MLWLKDLCILGVSFSVVFCTACIVHAAEVSFVSNPVWLSTTNATEGASVQASTVITKEGSEAISGTVAFYSNGKMLGTSDFTLPAGVGGVVVALSFVPEVGTHAVSAKITKAAAGDTVLTVTGEAKAGESLKVEPDRDRDTIPDDQDPDDDNNGVADAEEIAHASAGQSGVGQSIASTQVAASGEVLGTATDMAKNTGALVFSKTEDFRLNAADYFDEKLAEAATRREVKQSAAAGDEANVDKLLYAKPLLEQVKDTAGLFESVKIQALKILAFIFNNMYAFYLLAIVILLWLLRKIWRRYSLS